jgi:MFS family permease
MGRSTTQRRTLLVTGTAHALHDGYTDAIYALLPVWQAEFGLSYGLLALIRGVYAGAMAILQVPSGWTANRFGAKTVLALGTALAALGYLLSGFTGGAIGLCAALAVSGAGSSVQHPIGSAAVSRAFGANAREPLGIYNFSGDLGKAAIPAGASLLLMFMTWRNAVWVIAGLGCLVAVLIAVFMPAPVKQPAGQAAGATINGRAAAGPGFRLLLVIGILDTAVRTGFLMFLPFVLQLKGATLPTVGIALAMVFLGGAAGKFAFGWVGARIGVFRTVLLTEGGTAAAILLVLALPLAPALCVLPLLGVLMNGTSSVLYGTVPELSAKDRTAHFFALFYTGVIGSGAVAPVFYGALGDIVGAIWATGMTAITALTTIPFAFALSRQLSDDNPRTA